MRGEGGTLGKVFLFAVLAAMLISISVGCASGATAPEVEWNKTFGGTRHDHGLDCQQTADGGYIISGLTDSYGSGSCRDSEHEKYPFPWDIWLVKTDSSGNEQWNRTFDEGGPDSSKRVRQTADGGYILVGCKGCGRTWYAGEWKGLEDVWLIKTDPNGYEVWNKTFGGSDEDYANSVQQTSDGGYIIAGFTLSFGAGGDAWLVKTDSNGNEEWNQTFGGAAYDRAVSIQQTTDGGYIFAGGTSSYDDSDAWLVKTDTKGNKEWEKTFRCPEAGLAKCVQQTKDGGYILAGSFGTTGVINSTSWLGKTDSNGNMEWKTTFGGASRDFMVSSMQQTEDGGYILTGFYREHGNESMSDFRLVKTDSSGNEQWNMTLGGPKEDEAHFVKQTTDGGYIVGGSTGNYGAGLSDIWLIKIREKLKGPAPTATVTTTPTPSTTSIPTTPEEGEQGAEYPEPSREEKGIPGFEAVCVIAGLLTVAYLIERRERK